MSYFKIKWDDPDDPFLSIDRKIKDEAKCFILLNWKPKKQKNNPKKSESFVFLFFKKEVRIF